MKAEEEEVQFHSFLTSVTTSWSWVVNITHWPIKSCE